MREGAYMFPCGTATMYRKRGTAEWKPHRAASDVYFDGADIDGEYGVVTKDAVEIRVSLDEIFYVPREVGA